MILRHRYFFTLLVLVIPAIFYYPREIVIFSPIITLIFFLNNLVKINNIFTPIKFLTLGILYWGGMKSIGLFLSKDNDIPEISMYFYIITLFGVLLILKFFENKINKNEFFINKIEIDFSNFHYLLVLLIWTYLSLIIHSNLTGGAISGEASFVIVHVFQGPYLILGGVLFLMGIKQKEVMSLKRLFSYLIPFIVLWSMSSGALNRTSFILPIVFFIILWILINKNLLKRNIYSIRNFSFVLIILIIAFLSDIQRKMGVTLIDFILSSDLLEIDFYPFILESTFLPSPIDAEQYFSSLGIIYEKELFHFFGIFNQLISIFTPRIFFPNKEQTDISMILWDQGFLPQPAYYEIFLEPFIDSGPIGNYFFYIFLCCWSYGLTSMVRATLHTTLWPYYLSLYALLLVSLFMVIRGPVIFLAWYLIPSFLLMFFIYVLRIFKSRS